jgi:TPR repeat protein/uncharacterized caspase-like protein
VAGINDYKFPQHIEPTRCGQTNARAMAKVLTERYGFESEELTEADASRAGILDRLEQLGKDLGDDDVFLVYFAGHGQIIELPDGNRAGYLLPYDAELDMGEETSPSRIRSLSQTSTEELLKRWDDRAINMREIVSRLGTVKAQHVVVIVDACFSGFMTHLGGLIYPDRPDLEQLLRRRSRTVLAATTDNNLAVGPLNGPHSVFTSALLKRLKTKEPAALTEVFLDIRKDVAASTKDKPERFRMLPQRGDFGGDGGEFVFVPVDVPAEQMMARIGGSIDVVRGQLPTVTTATDVFRAFAVTDYHFSSHPIEREREWKDRVGRYEVAAGLGDPLSMATLHYCYSRGLGVPKDDREAYRWAVKAFDTGRLEGKHVLGRCLLQGIGTDRNQVAAERLIRAAADGGFPLSVYTLAMLRIPPDRSLAPQDLGPMKPLLEKAATAGVAPAKIRLAILSTIPPPGVEPDVKTTVRLLTEAADAGEASANFLLFDLYSHGVAGQPKDLELALTTLERGAAEGDAHCQLALACEYYRRSGYPSYGWQPVLSLGPDLPEAIKWAELAASSGFNPARVYLAEVYQGGEDRPAQPEKAKEYCELAAKGGYAPAIVRQGIWYLEGGLLGHDDRKAFACFQQAALMGDFRAYTHLAAMYEHAQGMDLRGYSRSEMIPVFKFQRLHCLIQAATIAKRLGVTGTLAERTLREIAGRVEYETLNELKARYPESYKIFMDEYRARR